MRQQSFCCLTLGQVAGKALAGPAHILCKLSLHAELEYAVCDGNSHGCGEVYLFAQTADFVCCGFRTVSETMIQTGMCECSHKPPVPPYGTTKRQTEHAPRLLLQDSVPLSQPASRSLTATAMCTFFTGLYNFASAQSW